MQIRGGAECAVARAIPAWKVDLCGCGRRDHSCTRTFGPPLDRMLGCGRRGGRHAHWRRHPRGGVAVAGRGAVGWRGPRVALRQRDTHPSVQAPGEVSWGAPLLLGYQHCCTSAHRNGGTTHVTPPTPLQTGRVHANTLRCRSRMHKITISLQQVMLPGQIDQITREMQVAAGPRSVPSPRGSRRAAACRSQEGALRSREEARRSLAAVRRSQEGEPRTPGAACRTGSTANRERVTVRC